jgi:hypothetical protein
MDEREMINYHGVLGNMQCKCYNVLTGGYIKFAWSVNTIDAGREGT